MLRLFQCYSGVCQGKNLSPVVFVFYLDDPQWFMSERTEGLSSSRTESRKLGWETEDNFLVLTLFILSYADYTTICAKSAVRLQQALDAVSDNYGKRSLQINVDKTKVVVFSERRIRKHEQLSTTDTTDNRWK